jgi:hypothetical protein
MKFKENKNLFVFNIDNVIDVITNSSSELFIFKYDNGEILYKILNSFENNFYNEIGKPVLLKKASDRLFNIYLNSLFPYQVMYDEIDQVILPHGVSFEDIYTLDGECFYFQPEDESSYDEDHDWDNKYCYKVENWRQKVQDFFDPGNSIWLLYIDDYIMTSEVRQQVKKISTYEHY